MYDQSFNLKAFQEIFDLENRKGNNIEQRFKSDFQGSLEILKDYKKVLKKLKSEIDPNIRLELLAQKKEIKKLREEKISEILLELTKGINRHKVELEKGDVFGKQTYKLKEDTVNFFVSKKIQQNINKIYDVKQNSRHAVLSELVNLIEDKFPKYVLRTDLKSFYESIPQKIIIDKINDDYLLSVQSKKFINQIFESYNQITNQLDPDNAAGVPRGIGISAYLSELFMRKIDKQISLLENVKHYTRYVDDIIVILIPETKIRENNPIPECLKNIKEILKNESNDKVKLNIDKTVPFDLSHGINLLKLESQEFHDAVFISKIKKNKPKSIDFLGYKIGAVELIKKKTENGLLKKGKSRYEILIELSDHKIKKYKNRIDQAFSEFEKKQLGKYKYSLDLLGERLKFLSSNTTLKNNKSSVNIGINFSNYFLTSLTALEEMDSYLLDKIGESSIRTIDKPKIEKYSFVYGFTNKMFYNFPIKSLKYKNRNSKKSDSINRRNKGVIQFGLTEINSIWKL